MVKIDHFHCFSDILEINSGPNEHIDMILSKAHQESFDTSLEYQHGVVWLQMVLQGSKMTQKE